VRDPAAIVAVGRVARLVAAHSLHRLLVRLRIVLDRDQGRHTADRRRVALVTGLQQQQRVRPHERRRHRHPGTVGKAEIAVELELLDAAEDVVPPARVQPRAVLTQLVQDLVHLERGQDRLDQDGGLDAPLRDTKLLLRGDEDVIPEARLEMRLHFSGR